MAIFANSVVLSMSRYPIDQDFEYRLSIMNLFFFFFFLFELLIKMVGRGFKYYFQETFNWFDTFVVVISAIDFIMQLSSPGKNIFDINFIRQRLWKCCDNSPSSVPTHQNLPPGEGMAGVLGVDASNSKHTERHL